MTEDPPSLAAQLGHLLLSDEEDAARHLAAGPLAGCWYRDLTDEGHEWISPGFWRRLGYDPGGRPPRREESVGITHASDLRVEEVNLHAHLADADRAYDQVLRYRHADGSTVWIRSWGVAERDEAGAPARMFGVLIDVSWQKEVEAELRRMTDECEDTNRRLRRSLEEAKILTGSVPICAGCKSVRQSEAWISIELYLRERTDLELTHGLCPTCAPKFGFTLDDG